MTRVFLLSRSSIHTMKILKYLLPILVFVVGSLASCNTDIKYSTNPGDRLQFSADTVRFDTVFTTIGSATQLLKVYNKNKQAVLLEQIRLENHTTSGFRINVDGMSGTEFNNVEVLGGDSLFIFVEVTIDPTSQNNPVLFEDRIHFTRAGADQTVLLEAFGQDAYIWKKKIIENDTILTGEKPFLLQDSLIVKQGVTLIIKENARFFFDRNVGFFVNGTVVAEGTTDNPIVFRGSRSDYMVGEVSYDLVPGQWEGVYVDSLSFGNRFENVQIRNANYGIKFHHSEDTSKKAILRNVIIHNHLSDGLQAINCDIDVYNSQISNTGGATVRLIGGKYDFIHCTIGNHFNWEARLSAALVVGNKLGDNGVPLQSFRLVNSIVEGSQRDEISFEIMEGIPVNYLFVSNLLKSEEKINAHFVNNLWNSKEKTFRLINEDNDRIYDFQLDSAATAINAASLQYALDLPIDLKGVSRLSDAGPDMGCYEFIPE